MDFGQLRQFIDDSLEDLSFQGGDDRPRSKEEFQALLEMLLEKMGASDLPKILPHPGNLPAFPQFALSEELKQQLTPLLDRRVQLRAELETARRNLPKPSNSRSRSMVRKIIKSLQRRLQLLEREIASLESCEKQDYIKRHDTSASCRAYNEAMVAHKRSIQQWEAEVEKRIQVWPLWSRHLHIVERIRKDIERAFRFSSILPTERLPWRVLPPGKLPVNILHQHYDRLQQLNPRISYEKERITKAFSLHPDQCYVGRDEFEGYIILTFAHTPKALLECPVFGNAIYIINSDWKRLSSKTKQELLTNHSGEITKIVHKGDWFSRVKRGLGIR